MRLITADGVMLMSYGAPSLRVIRRVELVLRAEVDVQLPHRLNCGGPRRRWMRTGCAALPALVFATCPSYSRILASRPL